MSKVTIRWEGEGDEFPEKKSKLAVPKSWSQRPVSDVIELFVKAYNDKRESQPPLVTEDLYLYSPDSDEKIFSDSVVLTSLGDHCDYVLKRGVHRQKIVGQDEVVSESSSIAGMVKCKNYGCQKLFREDENNNDSSCHHHTGPPIFWDTMKCWSCCKDRKAYDFESFQQLPTCATGRQSTVDPKVSISASPRTGWAGGEGGQTVFGQGAAGSMPPNDAAAGAAAPLKSIADYNSTNPSGPTAAASALKTVSTRKSTRNADGLTAKCQRKGCQKTFTISENGPSACLFHRGQPVFHDAVKFWSCCDGKKCYDFDEFLAVPGCATGWHDDGETDLST